MVNFCPNCGKQVNPDDKFCKSCGANVAGSVEAPKAAPVQISPKPGSSLARIIGSILGLFLSLGIIFLILYSLGCAIGMFPNTQDQMCKSIHQFFSFEDGTPKGDNIPSENGTPDGGRAPVNIGCQHCSPGYCWTGTTCCPKAAPYYCKGYCYQSNSDAYNAGCHQSSWTWWCCQ